MDRHSINWPYEQVDKDQEGDFVYYSDVIDLESEVNRLQVALQATVEEKERCRKLAVDWSLKADVYKASLEMCENMKLAREFEELLQTTSIPVAVEKVRGMMAVVAAVKSVCAGCPNEAKCNPDVCVYGVTKQPLSVLEGGM